MNNTIENSYPVSDVAFVIPARDEALSIGRCLEAINSCEKQDWSIEIIVLDNGSEDETVKIAKSHGAKVIDLPDVNISTLRNSGAAATDASYIGFIDADIIISHDWLIHCMREISREGVGMVGFSPRIPTDSTWVTRTWHLQISGREDYAQRMWLGSANIMVNRSAFLEVGGFDETLETCEDVDLGYRMSQQYKIQSDKRIHAIHLGETSTLKEFFNKEVWRGRSNYAGLSRHGIETSEIPSLVQPPVTLLGLVGIPLALIFHSSTLLILSILLFASYPLARSILIARRTKRWSLFPHLMAVWTVYSSARAYSFVKTVAQSISRIFP